MVDKEFKPDGIADDLRSAMADARNADTPGAAPEAPHGGETPEAPGAIETPEAAPAQTGTRPRAPDGKFAKMGEPIPGREPRDKLTLKPTDAPPATPGAPVAAQPAAGTLAPSSPPPGWSVASKAVFKDLPPQVQADIVKREAEISAGFKQYSERLGQLREVEPVLRERMSELTSNGRSVGESLNMLFAAGDLLANDTPAAIVQIANNAGISLAQLAAMQGGQAVQPGAVQSQDPMIQALARQVQLLTGHITQAQRETVQYERTQADSEIASFASHPDHVYFENVREDMAWLLQQGRASDLQDAYQTACRMNPEVSAAIINDRVKAGISKTQQDQAARAAQARRANGSLTGAPSPGSVDVTAPKDSLRSELTEAFRASRA